MRRNSKQRGGALMNGTAEIRRSMLWAAYGDALGFITELADRRMVKRRVGTEAVTRLMPWVRRLGGRFGADVPLPSGCYSDDTQLRLATTRAIRGNGDFDIEAFSKVELPVWRGYALGAGRGTKAAATALSRRDTQWSTNFFELKGQSYVKGGGNGAAMRIQPHVWAAAEKCTDAKLLQDVIRNAVTTHGHPTGIIGAAFHALCLRRTAVLRRVLGPREWEETADLAGGIAARIRDDNELAIFWIPTWEGKTGTSLEVGFAKASAELHREVAVARQFVLGSGRSADRGRLYSELAGTLDAFAPETVGSAIKTSVLAAFLACLYEDDAASGLRAAANLFGTDTDSIATMAGAILGLVAAVDPPDPVADQTYLETEARRLSFIARGERTDSFTYPDLLHWSAPTRETDIAGRKSDGFAVCGLGAAQPIGEPQVHRDTAFQWLLLRFGQKILVKLLDRPAELVEELLPFSGTARPRKNSVTVALSGGISGAPGTDRVLDDAQADLSLDEATDLAIRRGFEPDIVGRLLMRFAERPGGVDRAVSFAAIIAKAKQARMKRGG
jgi:ADP-ribosylglycohydrolase